MELNLENGLMSKETIKCMDKFLLSGEGIYDENGVKIGQWTDLHE
jgi:hypothetical protein